MLYENNTKLHGLLKRGGAPKDLREARTFLFDTGEFDNALAEVQVQHPYHDDEEARARAAYRLLTKTKQVTNASAPIKFWTNQRVWTWLRVAWAVAVQALLTMIAARPVHGQERLSIKPEGYRSGLVHGILRTSRLGGPAIRLAGGLGASPDVPSGIIIQVSNQGTVLATRPAGILKFDCSTGMSCSFSGITFTLTSTGGGGGSPAWSSIIAPTANLAINHAAFTTTFTWNAATGAGVNLFTEQDTTNNTGTGVLHVFHTTSGSALSPWQADANGVGLKLNTAGRLVAVGTGTVDYAALANFPAACSNQFATQIAATPGCTSVSGSFFANQNANLVFAGPSSGGAAAPSFRALVKADQVSTTVYTDQANTYTAGSKQTFQNSATTAGLNLASSADPSTLAQGDHWLNTDDLKWQGASVTHTAARSDGGGTNNKVAKFTGANTIANGGATDDGTTFSITDTAFVVPKAGGANPTAQGDVRYDTTQDAWMAGGRGSIKGVIPRVLASCWSNATTSGCFGTGASTANNDLIDAGSGTTETAFSTTYQFPANYFKANKVALICVNFQWTTTSSAPTLRIQGRVQKSGPTNVYFYQQNAVAPANSQTNIGFGYCFQLQGTGAPSATASLMGGVGFFPYTTSANTQNQVGQPVTVDTTVAQTFQLTVTWGTATSGNKIAFQQMVVMELT